jgi:hypothetical protein
MLLHQAVELRPVEFEAIGLVLGDPHNRAVRDLEAAERLTIALNRELDIRPSKRPLRTSLRDGP